MSSDVLDVAIETLDGNFYQFLSVTFMALQSAVEKGASDEVVLSLVSTGSAAIVVPWKTISRIMYAPIDVEPRDDGSWTTLWDRATAPKPKKRCKKKAAYGTR